jgi:hypothetical protein
MASRGDANGGAELFICLFVIAADLLASRFMNTLIENAETLEYLTNSGKWSKNPVEGKSFGATTAAFAAARLESIGKFNIVSYIAETRQFINLDHGRGKGVESVAA